MESILIAGAKEIINHFKKAWLQNSVGTRPFKLFRLL
jgi:hypothetical protein